MAFVGDEVTLTLTANVAAVGTPLDGTPLEVASATVDFGDGSRGTVRAGCRAPMTLEHIYHQAGSYEPTVVNFTTCGTPTRPDLSTASTPNPVRILPAAPAASASWAVCSTYQLHLAGAVIGAAAGTVGVRITLENRSSARCTLLGYPAVVLLTADRRLLPMSSRPAITGGGVFPPVVPHRVALTPGGIASFELSYADNPFGPTDNEPYDVACPPSRWLRVILPGSREYGTAEVPMQVCGGVEVSPIVPGSNGISY